MFTSNAERLVEGMFWDEWQAAVQRAYQTQQQQYFESAYRAIIKAGEAQEGKTSPTFERMSRGWSVDRQYRRLEDDVALDPSEVMSDLRMLLKPVLHEIPDRLDQLTVALMALII